MKKFKYMRSDFQELPVRLEHMDIYINILDTHVNGTNILRVVPLKSLDTFCLDAQGLKVHSIQISDGDHGTDWQDVNYEYREEANMILVRLPGFVETGKAFRVKTETTCFPTDNILDGLYKDTTPAGCPQQYMSQCQQWGFQRILPVIDDCTAKCTMRTTIEGDTHYTHLISNGNICSESNPGGRPVPKAGDPSRQVITYDNRIPMAPYLFLVCAGTWDVLEDEVVYTSGRKVRLEYLVPPGKLEGARIPMEILKESVLWQNRTQDYEYRYDVYRTICMEKSNFGGMENVGNTTIITSAALIDKWIGDVRLEYAHGVIVHEFEHNQCGSDVTMKTPFDMWLNEAFTVDVERQFMMDQFDRDRIRLGEIDSMRSPIGGPLAIEDGGHLGNIVREGFNNPDEVVDGVTYVKAAEVIRMLRLILGEETFRKAKNEYFRRFNGGNADTDDFFNCFEEVSGRDLSQFKREWLYTIGYPNVSAECNYDAGGRKLRIQLKQERSGKGGLFHLPITLSVIDETGLDVPGTAQIVEMTAGEKTVELDNIDKPSFVSFNRDCSFYGTFFDKSSTRESLLKQVHRDTNNINRVEAMRRLTDVERIKLVNDKDSTVSEEWLETYHSLLMDTSLAHGIKCYLLRIDELSLDRRYLPFYRERYDARIRLLKVVSEKFLDDLIGIYQSLDTYSAPASPRDGLDIRMLKAVLLRVITEADRRETHQLTEEHLRRAWNMSDKVSALSCINISSHPRRIEILSEIFDIWKQHLVAYTSYLQVVGGGTHDDVFDLIAVEERKPEFRIEHPSHNRALFLPMTSNNKLLWTKKGLAWLTDTVLKMTRVNENSALHLVSCLQQVNKLADDLKPGVMAALEDMNRAIDPQKYPSVSGRIRTFLRGS